MKLNLPRLQMLLQQAEDEGLTGQVVLHFHAGSFTRWEKNRSGSPKELPHAPILTPDPKPSGP